MYSRSSQLCQKWELFRQIMLFSFLCYQLRAPAISLAAAGRLDFRSRFSFMSETGRNGTVAAARFKIAYAISYLFSYLGPEPPPERFPIRWNCKPLQAFCFVAFSCGKPVPAFPKILPWRSWLGPLFRQSGTSEVFQIAALPEFDARAAAATDYLDQQITAAERSKFTAARS